MTDVSRGEFDMLRQVVDDVTRRLEAMDSGGTRGVGAMAVQVAELAKDFGELKTDVNTRFEQHIRQHDADLKSRTAARRWMIGTAVVGAGSMAAVIVMLLDLITRLH